MTIFDLFLTTLEESVIFWGSWGSSKNWLEPKAKPPFWILACQNRWNALYVCVCVSVVRVSFGIIKDLNLYFPCTLSCYSAIIKCRLYCNCCNSDNSLKPILYYFYFEFKWNKFVTNWKKILPLSFSLFG